jgi:hypothetical protein
MRTSTRHCWAAQNPAHKRRRIRRSHQPPERVMSRIATNGDATGFWASRGHCLCKTADAPRRTRTYNPLIKKRCQNPRPTGRNPVDGSSLHNSHLLATMVMAPGGSGQGDVVQRGQARGPNDGSTRRTTPGRCATRRSQTCGPRYRHPDAPGTPRAASGQGDRLQLATPRC